MEAEDCNDDRGRGGRGKLVLMTRSQIHSVNIGVAYLAADVFDRSLVLVCT